MQATARSTAAAAAAAAQQEVATGVAPGDGSKPSSAGGEQHETGLPPSPQIEKPIEVCKLAVNEGAVIFLGGGGALPGVLFESL